MPWPHWRLIGKFPRTNSNLGAHDARMQMIAPIPPANICEYGNLPNRMQYVGGDRVNGKCHYTYPMTNDKQCKALPFFLLLYMHVGNAGMSLHRYSRPHERSRRQLRMVFGIYAPKY